MDIFDLVAKLSLDTSEYEKGIKDAQGTANDLKDKWGQATGQMSKGIKSIGAGAGILTALGAGAFKAADGVSKNLDNIDKMSQKLGLSTDAYQEWDYVMKISGTSIDNMAMGLKTLTNKFDDAVNGGDSAIESFSRLGLSMEDIQGLSREDLFSKVIFAFQGMEDSAERAALANDLLGRSGQELAPLFNTSAEETQALIENVRDLGGVMSEDAVKQGATFQDSLTSLQTAFAGVSATLVEKLIPAVTNIMDKISKFVANGGLDKLISMMQTLAPIIGAVVTAIAGFKIISGIISLVQGFSTAFGVLNTVMAANPIGLVVLAIAGLVAAFAVLWTKCEGFREFFQNTFNNLGEFFHNFGEKVGKIKDGIVEKWNNLKEKTAETWSNIQENTIKAWENVKEKTAQAWSNIKDKVEENGGGIEGVIKTAVDAYKKIWETGFNLLNDLTGGALGDVINTIKEKFGNIKEKFSEIVENAKTWGKDMIQNFIDGIKEKVSAVVDAVKGVAEKIKGFIGFSEPTDPASPLHNFHTFAPDMMKLFAQGIRDNTDVVTDQIAKSFDIRNELDGLTSDLNYGIINQTGSNPRVMQLLEDLVRKDNVVVVDVSGEKLFNITRRKNNEYIKAHGVSAFARG